MAQKVLIIGESGTGKSTSMRNCNPDEIAVVNPVGKSLPFKGHFDTLDNVTDARKIWKYMQEKIEEGKKVIVIDDFQYILAVPYMNRIKETGWDKYNDFGSNYFQLIDCCRLLPDDVIVVYMSHLETLENGTTTVKLIGKLLREKITIEGLYSIVLRTGVNEGEYLFYTQNNGRDTVKSPLGMFPSYAIDNDLQYVIDKIRNYYELDGAKSDVEMSTADKTAASDLEKPDAKGHRPRRSRAAVLNENVKKTEEYQKAVDEAIDAAAGDKEEVDFDTVADAVNEVPVPLLETPPRKSRKERNESVTLEKNTYFYDVLNDNYVIKRAGDTVDLIINSEIVMKEITKEEFNAGVKKIAQTETAAPKKRTRRVKGE